MEGAVVQQVLKLSIYLTHGEKMRSIHCIAIALASIGALHAQSPNFGLSFDLGIPVGEFLEKKYAPTFDVPVQQIEGYDIGYGGRFTMSFPVQKHIAFCAGLGAMFTKGTNTASGFDTIYLKHQAYSLTAELQVFFRDAYRNQGTYLFGGIAGNLERFSRSFVEDSRYYGWYDSEVDVERKSRLGGFVGIGHSFYYGGGDPSFKLELSYNFTASNSDYKRGEPIAVDFCKISFGVTF